MRTEYNKLIRDLIPEIISGSGKTYAVASLSDVEFASALFEKLVEEAQEARSADQGHLLDELADVSEVIDTLLNIHGWKKSDLLAVQDKRRQERGRFEKRLKLLYVDDPSAAGSPAQKLADYIQSIPALSKYPAFQAYDHMGAVLTDAILQAGLNYDAVVLPRVKIILGIEEARTTSGFLSVLEQRRPENLLKWSDSEKPNRLVAIAQFFITERVETATELKVWLQNDLNIPRLKQQRGVGDKTADYFKILVGLSAISIDRHAIKFLEEAGLPTQTYQEAQKLIHSAADIVGVDYSVLDHNIWKYMSTRRK